MVSEEEPKSWKPDKPTSSGASSYHDAVVNAPYYAESLEELARVAKGKIKENDVVVDFGAGTGVSAIALLKSIKFKFKLWLVDNSPSWLGKAYEIFKENPNVKCYLLRKAGERYATLSETVGKGKADHVLSANTIHLVPNLKETFNGINETLKKKGSFMFQSSNIDRKGRKTGVLMMDDCIKRIHEIAIDLIREDKKFEDYKTDIDKKIELARNFRKFVFPDTKPLEVYLKDLKNAGFEQLDSYYKTIRVKYTDWMKFVRVRALQAGILPEIGGKDPTDEEVNDRDAIVTAAALGLFKELEETNPMATGEYFTSESIYITTVKAL